jgi:hypothetical protein
LSLETLSPVTLKTQFEKYFPVGWNVEKPFRVIKSLNAAAEKTKHLSLTAQEEITELLGDKTFQEIFRNESACNFWLNVENKYPIATELAIRALLPFATSCFLNQLFQP